MADSHEQEYFPVGTIVQCITCVGETVEGEVVAFDHKTKVLALKSFRQGPGWKKSQVPSVQLINVNLVQDMNVLQEAPPVSSQAVVPNFSYTKLARRAVDESIRKRRSICADSVSLEGQKLFVTIRKTIDDVQWKDGENILVLLAVIVSPPYKSENVQICINDDHSQHHRITRAQAQNTADHVRKIIEQFWSKHVNDTDSTSNLDMGEVTENNGESESQESTESERTSPS